MVKLMSAPLFRSIVAAAALCVCGAAAAEVKIASIRLEEVALKSPQFKANQEKFRSEFDKRQKDLEAELKKFDEDVKKFKTNESLVSADQKAKSEKELGSRQVDLNYKQKQFQDDATARNQALMQDLQTKLKTVIDQVAKEKGLDLVVHDPVYASDAIDISDDVLKKLASSPAAAPGK